MAVPFCRETQAILVLALLSMFLADATAADRGTPGRRGKVVIIRGAFTIFSLGMNDLGDKLREHGLDVEVVADISASRATARIREEYQRTRNYGPIVFIGHSRGAELAPKQARELQPYRIPVKLVVMVDAVHATTIPANVERCVNLYHSNIIIMPHGVPATAESRRTQLVNTNIDLLPSRDEGGSINHFNIDSSDWIHDLVITEVLRACGLAGPTPAPPTVPVAKAPPARRPAAAPPQPTGPIAAPWQPKSGLRFPAS
ncbi:MAG: hypothetical protein FJ276_35160, partial [Planctomycetes bacterium]|nr:hypothetical protein [Planctomycetota bacterium]